MLLQTCLEQSTDLSLQKKNHTQDYRRRNAIASMSGIPPASITCQMQWAHLFLIHYNLWENQQDDLQQAKYQVHALDFSAESTNLRSQKNAAQDPLQELTNLSLQQKDHTPNYNSIASTQMVRIIWAHISKRKVQTACKWEMCSQTSGLVSLHIKRRNS